MAIKKNNGKDNNGTEERQYSTLTKDILTLLNHATSYTDKDRSWCYMLVPSMNVKK